jgi:hypothetical protein
MRKGPDPRGSGPFRRSSEFVGLEPEVVGTYRPMKTILVILVVVLIIAAAFYFLRGRGPRV